MAKQLESFVFSVSFYAFNLEQSKVYRLQDYKHYIKVFKLVLLQTSFLASKNIPKFYTLTYHTTFLYHVMTK